MRQLARLVMSNVRRGDIACRLGGDELVLILPEASREATLKRAEKLREAVKQLQVEYESQWLEPSTISLGVAVFPDHGHTVEAILKSADQALYRAKSGGRDRVVTAGSREQAA